MAETIGMCGDWHRCPSYGYCCHKFHDHKTGKTGWNGNYMVNHCMLGRNLFIKRDPQMIMTFKSTSKRLMAKNKETLDESIANAIFEWKLAHHL